MSTKIQKDIVCPACGQTQKLEMYTSVNAEENPELRRDILRESMFDWECLHCGYTAQMAYPMIYHDPMNAFMICLRPSGAVSGAEPIPAVRALKKRSVKNPQELKEKYSEDELYYFLDLIDEYYSESGILDAKPDEDGCIEVDLGQIVDYIIKEAHKDEMGEYDPEEILFVVQGELEYTESLDDDEE